MLLFDDIPRTNSRPRLEAEGMFEYLNSSGRPGMEAIRSLLDEWFVLVPPAHAADMARRFGKGKSPGQHEGAFWELYMHTLLRKLGFGVQIHPSPSPDGTAHPDFLATRFSDQRMYVEAKVVMRAEEDAKAEQRVNKMWDALSRMDSPNFFLAAEFRGASKADIDCKKLCNDLERWLDRLDHTEMRRRHFDDLPSITFAPDGLELTFRPIPKLPQMQRVKGTRTVGVRSPMELREIEVHQRIRGAVGKKAKKYGGIAAPFILALNVQDEFCEWSDIADALFGDVEATLIRSKAGTVRNVGRCRNGALFGPQGPKNRQVSAVLVAEQMSPTTLRTHKVHFVHNPYAAHPIPADWFPFPQVLADSNGTLRESPGTLTADILEILDPSGTPFIAQ